MQRSAEFYRGALWHWGTGCNRADIVELLAEAEAREGREMEAVHHRIKQLEAMNAGLLLQLSNIHIACKPANIKAPDGKEWTFHPPDELVRRYWETLSKAVQEALASVPTAAEPDLGTAAPTRTGTIQVALRDGGAGKPLEYVDERPSAAEVIAAAHEALLEIDDYRGGAETVLEDDYVTERRMMVLAAIAKWKESQRG